MNDDRQPVRHIEARDARGGAIILRSSRSRVIFAGGLALFAVVALLVA